ncbi:MAG: serine/threonine protein kinase [Hyphomicrobiales bacterium]|nr:serine/threonine protein kinase [Hyphomicrobiales bacterium]
MARQQLQTGSTLDGFLIGEKLHAGGMATLWRVTRPGIDIPIVMKVPTILDGDDATIIVGFEMEMMILPRLSGVHVPRCIAVKDFAQQPYIVMEYIQGHSLLKTLDEAPLPPDRVAEIGAKVAVALIDLHRQNVVHLDIKPSNIMMRDTGEAAFIDFGLSRHLSLPDLLEEEFRVPMGTGPYISPEQVLHNRSDVRSDIFSLGVLLYHFATRVRPWGLPKSSRALRRRLWRDPVPPRKLRPDIPPWLQEVILRCLEPDPTLRYPTAAQLAFDLQHPDEIRLTERATRMERAGFLPTLRRRMKAAALESHPREPGEQSTAAAPIVMAAVDLSEGMERLSAALRLEVARVLGSTPGVRLACVNVLRQNRIAMNYPRDEEGRNIHMRRLVELKEWARPLKLDQGAATFHVLEAADTAAALVEFATANHVDQVLICARASSNLRRFVGSVSSQVVAEAPCTVTVVRLPQGGETSAATTEIAAAITRT